jgi:hypothetical protein
MVIIFMLVSFGWLFCLIGDLRITFLDDGKVTWRDFFTAHLPGLGRPLFPTIRPRGQPSRPDVKRKQTQSFTLMERSRE